MILIDVITIFGKCTHNSSMMYDIYIFLILLANYSPKMRLFTCYIKWRQIYK
jgi:hypothetical protein